MIEQFRFLQGDFAACGRLQRSTVPVLLVAFPRTPVYGGYPLKRAQPFRRVRPGVLGCHSIRPHWGPKQTENYSDCSPTSAPEFAEPTSWGRFPL